MSTATLHPAVETFVHAVEEIVVRGGTEQEITAEVAEHLRPLVAHGVDIVPEAYRQPREDMYAMYPLYVAPDHSFCVAAAVWGIGQVTPIHDHGTWGVIGIVDGVEHEARFAFPQGGRAPAFLGEHDLVPGDVDVCCTSDQDIHRVSCEGDRPTVALHVYGGDIGTIERRAYDPDTGEVKMFQSRWAA